VSIMTVSGTDDVAAAYSACEAITRKEAKNFAYGIRLLRPPERRAMSATYALARRIDDIGDGSASAPEKLAALQEIRSKLRALATQSSAGGAPLAGPGSLDDPVLRAVADAARRYELPLGAFAEIIDGCEMDVAGTRYETIEDLLVYCRDVAGSVGRLSLAILRPPSGEKRRAASTPDAERLADVLGAALQLTNILRDVVEDRSLGRVYLPRADAEAAGCSPDLDGPDEEIARLVALECRRARGYFEEGWRLLQLLEGRSRACVASMAGIYQRLLLRIEQEPVVVMRGRLSLSTREKLSVAIRALAMGGGGER
jgi:15-cis-phytoene synthase